WYRKLVELDRAQPVGAIGDAELASLRAATLALLGDRIDERRYEDFFRWKAANAAGYLPLYARFHAAVERAAKKRGAASYAAADASVKSAVLAPAARVREMINADDKVGGLRFALFDRDWLLFERYIVREVLTLFARTDAWLISGYGPHPGVPRGLEAYR